MLLRNPAKGPGRRPGGKGPGPNKPKGTKKPPHAPRITTPVPPPVTQPREDAGRQTEEPSRPTKSDLKNPSNSETPADQQPSSEEEWSWYGLTRNDLIAIGVPTVIAVPSKLF